MSKLSNALETDISELEDKVLDRDTCLQAREWAQNMLRLDNQLIALRGDAMRTNFPTEHQLPLPLTTAARDDLDKMAKTAIPHSKRLTELFGEIEQILALMDKLDDSDITPETIQRAQDAIKVFKKGQSAGQRTFATTRAQSAEPNIMRNLDGFIQITHTDPNGVTKVIRRNGDFVGTRYAIKEIVDEWSNKLEADKASVWGEISTILTNMNEPIKSANEGGNPVNETFQDQNGNLFEVAFPA